MNESAASRVLEWIEEHIQQHQLTVGDALPGELEIARATQVGRSSVREALTALKVLGIIQSRRKGGIRLVRDPVLLELRHYFAEVFDGRSRYLDAMEFRAALEWGLGPLALARVRKTTLTVLRELLHEVEQSPREDLDITEVEIRFHSLLTAGCGNRLAALFGHLYGPIFHEHAQRTRVWAQKPGNVEEWLEQHWAIVAALETRDEETFLARLREHTHNYMRWPKTSAKVGNITS